MPGISLKCHIESTKTVGNNDELFLKALDSTVLNDSYKREILLEQYPYLLGYTKYAGYPVEVFEDHAFWICIEGRIYNKEVSVLTQEIGHLINYIFSSSSFYSRSSDLNEDKKVIVDWLLQTDGDFVIFALDKITKSFVIVNDVLGRLPIYYYCQNETELIVSREAQLISFLVQNNDSVSDKFDRMGIAQFLLFSHTFGNRTLLKNMYRLEPGSILRIYTNNKSEFKVDSLYRFNFDRKIYAEESIQQNAQRLVSLFSEACKNRASNHVKNVISLSGGLDSRAVAACMHKIKLPCDAVTFLQPGRGPVVGNTSEVQVAEKLANLFGFDWENYGLVKPGTEHIVSLLNIKNGLISLGYGFLLLFLQNLEGKHSPSETTLFTGHGGDIIFANITDRERPIVNLENLVRHIIQDRSYLSLGDVAEIIQIKETDIINEIKNVLSSYPEKNRIPKYLHYLFYELVFKVDHEAEDLHKYYFWSVSPFYSVPFFNYAVNCSYKNKSRLCLYREFLLKLSPAAAALSSSNWGCSILSKKYEVLQFILALTFRYGWLKKILKRIAKLNNKDTRENSRALRCITGQIKGTNRTSNYLSKCKIENILDNYTEYSHVGMYNLLTVASLLEKLECNHRAIHHSYDH
jgi:asparagine synthase (glutamine-hydrolysing)